MPILKFMVRRICAVIIFVLPLAACNNESAPTEPSADTTAKSDSAAFIHPGQAYPGSGVTPNTPSTVIDSLQK